MASLTNFQKNELRRAYNEFKDDIHEYGVENGDEISCKRVRKPHETYDIDGIKFYKYQISKTIELIDNNKDIPIGKEMSHICNTPKKPNKKKRKYNREKGEKNVNPCIEPDHIEFATHSDNCSRRTCHNNLKKYVSKKQPNRFTEEKDKLKAGPIYINDIPIGIRKTGIFDIKQQQELLGSYQCQDSNNNNNNTLRRSIRIKDFKIRCQHDSHRKCFINNKRIEKHAIKI